MDMESILLMLVMKFPALAMVLIVLGSLVVLGQVIVMLTPTKKDDEALAKAQAIPILGALLTALMKFAVIQKKQPELPPREGA